MQWVLTHGYLCRKHFSNVKRLDAHIRRYHRKFMRLQFLRGLIARNFDALRGVRDGQKHVPRILNAPLDQMGETLIQIYRENKGP